LSLTQSEEHKLRLSEQSVLRRIFGTNEEEARGWRRVHNEELHNLYASPNIIRVIKSRRMRWTRHVERMADMRNSYNILVRKLEVDHSEDLHIDGRIILEWILGK
jgi:hypothetical protein